MPQWEAYTTDLRRQIAHGTTHVTTLTRRVKDLKQQLNGSTPLTSETSPPQKALAIIQRPENQHRPLLAALNLTGLLQATVSLDLADLSVRTHNALKRNSIKTLNDLLTLTPYQIMSFRNLGSHSLKEIEERIRALWPHLPAEYFPRTVFYVGAAAAAWRVQPPYGRPRY